MHCAANANRLKQPVSYLVSEGLIATTQSVVLSHALHSEVRDTVQTGLAHDERNNCETQQQRIGHELQEAAVGLGELRQASRVGFHGAGGGDHLAQQECGACMGEQRSERGMEN